MTTTGRSSSRSAGWPKRSAGLRRRTPARASRAEERRRARELEVTLDRLWDLLRQRRALRDAGRSPDEAIERPAGTVEGYLQ